MKKRFYIAYGSNLSEDQMKVRCPDAKAVGLSKLQDMQLVFCIHATIEPCIGKTVPVVVWQISMADERSLDMYEGFPYYYRKEEMEITMTDFLGKKTKKITAMIYIMNDGHDRQRPMKHYYETLKNAYVRFGFDSAILADALSETKER